MTKSARATEREGLEPFRPGTDGPWDLAAAAHLTRRAAFGCPRGLVARVLEQGPRDAAETLLLPRDGGESLSVLGDSTRQIGSLESVQGWWLYRLLLGPSPAREKLALFWHGHFATSDRKVDSPRLMMGQVEKFLELGGGPFGDLLLAMSRDPAMLLWLDGNANRRGKPNENFARELMELFSLGIGNYTEADIKEAARAFTGWHVRNGGFFFNRGAHDVGAKVVFGSSGVLGGEDVVSLCAARTACSEFIASRLYGYYVHPRPSKEMRAELGRLYDDCGKRTAAFLVRLWSSRAFFEKEARRSIVAQPVDFAVGALATLGATASLTKLAKLLAQMGQDLLQPPSVKGWDPGLSWLNSTTLLARYRFAVALGEGGEIDVRVPWAEIEREGAARLVERLVPEGIEDGVRADLEKASEGSVRALTSLILQLPELQYI